MMVAPFDLVAVAAGGASGEGILRSCRLLSVNGLSQPLQAGFAVVSLWRRRGRCFARLDAI